LKRTFELYPFLFRSVVPLRTKNLAQTPQTLAPANDERFHSEASLVKKRLHLTQMLNISLAYLLPVDLLLKHRL
jgi:hypothetical protein